MKSNDFYFVNQQFDNQTDKLKVRGSILVEIFDILDIRVMNHLHNAVG